jgi:hypothetical protein
MKPIVKKLIRITLGAAAAVILVLAAAFMAIVQPGGSGVLASIRLADGSEYMVTQRCNWGGEPYTVAFYMRSADEPWGWCYIDHQANRWRNVAMTYDQASDTITVTERGVWQAALNRQRKVFATGNGKPRSETDAPQTTPVKPGYAFPLVASK